MEAAAKPLIKKPGWVDNVLHLLPLNRFDCFEKGVIVVPSEILHRMDAVSELLRKNKDGFTANSLLSLQSFLV